MDWNDLTTNFETYIGRLKTRFPNMDESATAALGDRDAIVKHIAQKHDLTQFEADREMDDWLFVENLARRASDLRAG